MIQRFRREIDEGIVVLPPLATERDGEVHYFYLGEYEMAFESLVLDLMKAGVRPRHMDFNEWLDLALTLGLMNFVNLAHGSFAMAGGYVTLLMVNRWGVPFFVALPLAFLVSAALIALLHRAAAQLRRLGGSLAVVCPQPDLRRMFDLTLLSQGFPVFATRDEALRTWR